MTSTKNSDGFHFAVQGESKEDLKFLRDKLARSKAFMDAPSGMSIGFVWENGKGIAFNARCPVCHTDGDKVLHKLGLKKVTA